MPAAEGTNWLARDSDEEAEAALQTGSNHRGRRRYTCKFVFIGIDPDRDAAFELVPRLIGRQGVNMRRIAEACDGKVRIRGRGSGHPEQQKLGRITEADIPLQIALSCRDRWSFEEGRFQLHLFLEGITMHFGRYCRRIGVDPPPPLYTVVGDA